MLTAAEFQQVVFQTLTAEVVRAGDPPPASPPLTPSDEERALQALTSAAKRLRDNPSLLSGDPEGDFTFEDPILAVASYWARKSEEAQALLVSAGSPGADLKAGVRLSWMLTGVHAFLSRGNYARVELGGRTTTGPVEVQQEHLRIAIVGDAGYKGLPQDNVIGLMLDRHTIEPFHFMVHLGDVYFAGGIEEMTANFLNPFSKVRNAGPTVYTLLGNHDLYYGGQAYLFALNILGQPGRYFVIENPQWRIACLDTSLGAQEILGNDAKLDESQLDWLDSLLRKNDSKKLVLMSHHFLISGWQQPAVTLSDQLRTRVKDRVFSWYWGHEHAAALYGKESYGFYGACVGNGSFLEKWSTPNPRLSRPQWYATGHCDCFKPSKNQFWQHGYLELDLFKDKLVETVWLEDRSNHARTLPRGA